MLLRRTAKSGRRRVGTRMKLSKRIAIPLMSLNLIALVLFSPPLVEFFLGVKHQKSFLDLFYIALIFVQLATFWISEDRNVYVNRLLALSTTAVLLTTNLLNR